MKQNLTELVFILDRSGSMAELEKDTIGGYNAMLEQQRKVDGECVITTVLFDNHDTLLHDRIDIRAVNPITGKDYFVGGSTALLDAIGKTIHKIATAQKNAAEDYRAEKVMFVIITDGEENASREYSARLGIRSICLCACRLNFFHPVTGKQMEFEIREYPWKSALAGIGGAG